MDHTRPAVSILIVAYNSRGFIERCLASIPGGCGNTSFEVLLIDNGEDDTEGLVRDRFPHVRIVPRQGNVGYGMGNNILAAHAHLDSDMLILNPDTQVLPGAIEELVRSAQDHPEFGALSGVPTREDGKQGLLPLVALPSMRGVLYGIFGMAHKNAQSKMVDSTKQGPLEMEVLSGFFVLIRRAAWNSVGGFDDSFFLYGEDTDLSFRLAQTGMKLGLVPTSQVKHDTGSGAHFSTTRQHFKMLGTAHYANKHFGPIKRNAFKLALWLQCLTKYLGSSLLKNRGKRMASMADAFRMPALKPWRWYNGYQRTGADPRKK